MEIKLEDFLDCENLLIEYLC